MPGKPHTTEQIIHKLRQAEVELSQGATVSQAYLTCPGCATAICIHTVTYSDLSASIGSMEAARIAG